MVYGKKIDEKEKRGMKNKEAVSFVLNI